MSRIPTFRHLFLGVAFLSHIWWPIRVQSINLSTSSGFNILGWILPSGNIAIGNPPVRWIFQRQTNMYRGTLISLAKLFGASHPFLEHLLSLFHLVKPPPPQKKTMRLKSAFYNPKNMIWLVVILTILKNDGVRQWVSDDIPNIWHGNILIHVPNHQPVISLTIMKTTINHH